MIIILYTYDLCPSREYLMPWRTILEVAMRMKADGHETYILNACYNEINQTDYEWQGIEIKGLPVGYQPLIDKAQELNAHVLFVPVTWREGLKNMEIFSQLNCKKIAYLSGGVYDLQSANLLRKISSMAVAKPYLIESLIPKRMLGKALRKAGFSHTIGLTQLTGRKAHNSKAPGALNIYPGNDSFIEIVPDYSIIEKYGLKEKKWLLFSGAPASTRGADILLQAIDKAAEDSIRLVMLMRTDVGSDYENFNNTLQRMQHPERVLIIEEKITRKQLRAFFGSAWYALLPFVVIPSEIPLTYFELLSCNTPIISFSNGGTTEYLEPALVLAKKSVSGLSKTLDLTWEDINLRAKKSKAGLEIMRNHPSWEVVAKMWESLIQDK